MPVKDDFISYQNDSFSLIENKKKALRYFTYDWHQSFLYKKKIINQKQNP